MSRNNVFEIKYLVRVKDGIVTDIMNPEPFYFKPKDDFSRGKRKWFETNDREDTETAGVDCQPLG